MFDLYKAYVNYRTVINSNSEVNVDIYGLLGSNHMVKS